MLYVLGGPGSGKGTQCAKLVSDFDFIHVSTGDLLREEVKNKGPNAEDIEKVQKEGGLASSELLCTLIKGKFEKFPKTAKFLLDGFPRCQENLDAWDKIIKDSVKVTCLLYLVCSEETMTKRLLGRGEGRSDDNPEAIKIRLDTFNGRTIPMIEKLMSMVVEISSEESAEEVHNKVKSAIEAKGFRK